MAKRNRFKNSVLVQGAAFSVMAGALSLGLSSVAKAAVIPPVTFAQYEQNSSTTNANVFHYTEFGAPGANSTLTAVSIPVWFSFESLPGLPADLQGPQSATLTLTTLTTSVVTLVGSGFTVQPFSTLANDTLTITRTTPAAEGTGLKTNLLTMNFTGQMYGTLGGYVAQLTGQTTNGATINYNSDFLSFGGTVKDYSLNFTSWTTLIDSSGLTFDPSLQFYETATAAGTGSFDANLVTSVVPEPLTGTLALTSLGMLVLGRRNRSR